jgi:hypothetical protein
MSSGDDQNLVRLCITPTTRTNATQVYSRVRRSQHTRSRSSRYRSTVYHYRVMDIITSYKHAIKKIKKKKKMTHDTVFDEWSSNAKRR